MCWRGVDLSVLLGGHENVDGKNLHLFTYPFNFLGIWSFG